MTTLVIHIAMVKIIEQEHWPDLRKSRFTRFAQMKMTTVYVKLFMSSSNREACSKTPMRLPSVHSKPSGEQWIGSF